MGYRERQLTWDDLRAPATQVHINPATLKPDYDDANVGLLFDGSNTETVDVILQLPHEYIPGSEIHPHVHWVQASAGNVLWRMEYCWSAIGGTHSNAFTSIDTHTGVFSYPGTGAIHQISAFPAISGSGVGISTVFQIRLSRIGGDGLDTYSGDCLMLEFDLHYQKDGVGSQAEYAKY